MVCGTTQIWPMPTGRVSLSKRSLTFSANQMNFEVRSAFAEAKQLLIDAYHVFLVDLKTLDMQHSKLAMSANRHGADKGGASANRVASDAKRMQNCDIDKVAISADIQSIADTALHLEMDESYELNVTGE